MPLTKYIFGRPLLKVLLRRYRPPYIQSVSKSRPANNFTIRTHVDWHIVNLARKIPSSVRSCAWVRVRVCEREREMHATYILNGGPIAVAHVGVAESLSQKKKPHWS